MTTSLNPYIAFRDGAREALEFYADALGGEIQISTFGEFGVPDAPPDGVMHGVLKTPDGLTLMASDTPPPMEYDGSHGRISVALMGADPALAERFAKLAVGGTINQPLKKQIWGDMYGDLTDKYGIRWMVDIESAT